MYPNLPSQRAGTRIGDARVESSLVDVQLGPSLSVFSTVQGTYFCL